MQAFERAIALGVDGIEFDLQLSADGHLLIHHDARLKAEATRRDGVFLEKPTPRIDALAFAELQNYDVGRFKAGSPYAARHPDREHMDGAQIPSLAAFDILLAEQTGNDFRAYAELKTDMRDAARAEALADAYIAALQASPAAGRHTVVSFDWRSLNRVRAAFPDMRHAYTTMGFAETDPEHESAAQDKPDGMASLIRAASRNGAPWWDGMDWRDMEGKSHGERVLRAIKAGGGTGWFADWRDITEENMLLASDLGLTVSAWTINQAAGMQRLAHMGVAAIITDRPDLMKNL